MGTELKPQVRNTLAMLQAYQRDPFLQLLEDLLGCAPSQESMQAFATKFPDKWANMVAIFARLGGFTEKTEAIHTHEIKVSMMSDMELVAALKETQEALRQMPKGPLIDLTPDAPTQQDSQKASESPQPDSALEPAE